MTTEPTANTASASFAGMQQANPHQQGLVMINISPGWPTKLGIMKRTTRALGISQLLCGTLTVLFGVISAVQNQKAGAQWTTVIGSAFWGGVLMIVGGVVGIMSSRHQNSYKLNGVNMAFSIVGSLVGFINLIIFASGVSYFDSHCRYRRDVMDSRNYDSQYNQYHSQRCKRNQASLGLHAAIMLLGLAEFIIGMVAAVMCCSALCQCCKQKKGAAAGQPLVAPGAGGQPIIMTSTAGSQPMLMTSNAGGQPMLMVPNQMPVHYSTAAGQPMMYSPGQQAMYMPQLPQVVYSQQNKQQAAQGAQCTQGAQGAKAEAPPDYEISQDQAAEKKY